MSGLNDLELPCKRCGAPVFFMQEGDHCARCSKVVTAENKRKDRECVERCRREEEARRKGRSR
jgi:uncharacterized Zn finger protein (UPF0148 family)